jgi:hypothetical protein
MAMDIWDLNNNWEIYYCDLNIRLKNAYMTARHESAYRRVRGNAETAKPGPNVARRISTRLILHLSRLILAR